MASEVNRGERRTHAKRLKVGQRILRSVEDKSVPSFVIRRVNHAGDYVRVEATDGTLHYLWPTDCIIVAARAGGGTPNG